MNNQNIKSVLVEERLFAPSPEFTAQARLNPEDVAALRAEAASNHKGFWARQAQTELRWHKPFSVTLDESKAPNYRWFVDGELNVSHNCLDVHLEERGHKTAVTFYGHPVVTVRPAAFRRLVGNLVSNAARFAKEISITGHRDHRYLTVTIDDDGPGIPANLCEEVFKPFLRLDDARNQDQGGTGLGLAIARDIARSHGGDIVLGDSPLGGLRATVRVPV